MTDSQFYNEVSRLVYASRAGLYGPYGPIYQAIQKVRDKGREFAGRGAPAKRAFYARAIARACELESSRRSKPMSRYDWQAEQRERRKRGALRLARMADQYYDEHGSTRGDYFTTEACDFVPAAEARQAPYCDLGGEGIGLIFVKRRRVYAKSSRWRPRETGTHYLVGRNEAGTYWAHPVPPRATVASALEWLWSDKAGDIIARQGDIALVRGSGPKLPALPAGHEIDGDRIVHASHPPLPLPGKGERIIVARRAHARVSEATRD